MKHDSGAHALHESRLVPLDDHYEIAVNSFIVAGNNHLFNEPRFFELHATSPNDVYAQLVRKSDKAVCATIAYYEKDDGQFVSPKRGTFGGLGLNRPLDRDVIERFFLAVFDYATRAGARTFLLAAPPLSHDPSLGSIMCNILLRHGWTLSGYDLNYDMRVDDRQFVDRIDYGNVKRIRKCIKEGFVAEYLDKAGYEAAYRVIAENRQRRGFPMSMTSVELNKMAEVFSERFHCFAVYSDLRKAQMLAAAVCLSLSSSILYVFYWGDAADMQQYSPIALLASCIYGFCQLNAYTLLDAGTSTLKGEPNPGLITFKRNLGFTESLKPSFTC